MEKRDIGEFYQDLFGLQGKVAVVIGGTGVLCGSMARGLLQAGCRVVLVGRQKQKAEDHFLNWGSSPKEARFFKADMTNREEVEKIIPAVLGWFGGIDVWINGAAHGALLQSTRGDTSMITLDEVLHVLGGGTARIKR